MILPITIFGHPTLKKVANDIDADYPELNELIENMWETMYHAQGVGLAAPQINKSIRLFVIDATVLADELPEAADFKKVFLNAHITERNEDFVSHDEGCLSVPGVRESVSRPDKISITYYDENWVKHEEEYEGYLARIIQHEYDHIDGILFTDRVAPLRKMLIKKQLKNLSLGKFNPDYKVILPPIKKKGKR